MPAHGLLAPTPPTVLFSWANGRVGTCVLKATTSIDLSSNSALVLQPDHRYAKLALRDSIDLLASGKPGWFSDLIHSLQTLPIPVRVSDPLNINKEMVDHRHGCPHGFPSTRH